MIIAKIDGKGGVCEVEAGGTYEEQRDDFLLLLRYIAREVAMYGQDEYYKDLKFDVRALKEVSRAQSIDLILDALVGNGYRVHWNVKNDSETRCGEVHYQSEEAAVEAARNLSIEYAGYTGDIWVEQKYQASRVVKKFSRKPDGESGNEGQK